MRADKPDIHYAVWIIDPDHDPILVAGDVEDDATILQDACRPDVALHTRRIGPIASFHLPNPCHHRIARVFVGRSPRKKRLQRAHRDDSHADAVAWSRLGAKPRRMLTRL